MEGRSLPFLIPNYQCYRRRWAAGANNDDLAIKSCVVRDDDNLFILGRLSRR